MFTDLIKSSIEVYVDDMLIKSIQGKDHANDQDRVFSILMRYKIRLNPKKRAFAIAAEKFLSFIINQRGIKVNLEKIQALLNMESPKKPKDL